MDRLEGLTAQRDRLVQALTDPGTPASALAAISRELRALRSEIDALGEGAQAEVSKADELAARRADRRSDSGSTAPAARRSQPRRSNGSHRTS